MTPAKEIISLCGKRVWGVLKDSVVSFRTNSSLSAASSLAFSAMLALIPALFLITIILGAAVGSSQQALLKTQEIVNELIPRYSSAIIREVRSITAHTKAIGIANVIVLFWTITPLVSGLRVALNRIFRTRSKRPFLLDMVLDMAMTVVVLIGFSIIAVSGIIITFLNSLGLPLVPPAYFGGLVPFLFVTIVVAVLYSLFSSHVPFRRLVIGALVTAVLWMSLRPVFSLFLAYNPEYGVAFGSFKSLFIVIIWIYYSLAVFLFGAEVAASADREELSVIRRLIERTGDVPSPLKLKFSRHGDPGSVIFREGDPGDELYVVLQGRVGIYQNEKEIATISEKNYFGEMSFLLSEPRSASAVALTDVELLTINNKTVGDLIRIYPDIVFALLREMAARLRETGNTVV